MAQAAAVTARQQPRKATGPRLAPANHQRRSFKLQAAPRPHDPSLGLLSYEPRDLTTTLLAKFRTLPPLYSIAPSLDAPARPAPSHPNTSSRRETAASVALAASPSAELSHTLTSRSRHRHRHRHHHLSITAMAFRLPSALTRAPVRSSPLQPIFAPFLALILFCLFVLTSDDFIVLPLLYSRCHAHAVHPSLSRALPFFGPLACFAVSFFENALASSRGLAVMASVFALTAALLTVSYLESARRVAGPPGDYLRRLGLLWILVHLGGGPFVFIFIAAGWIITTHREVRRINRDEAPASDGEDDGDDAGRRRSSAQEEAGEDADALESKKRRTLRRRRLSSAASALAISDAVLIGFALPAALALIYRSTGPISLWLFFPLWVILLRYLLVFVIERLDARHRGTQAETTPPRRRSKSLDLESSRLALALVYAVPILLSLAAHVALIWSLTRRDDSKEDTRSVLCLRRGRLDCSPRSHRRVGHSGTWRRRVRRLGPA